jgi:small, acid-soluble spore proteins, alpha/beta type
MASNSKMTNKQAKAALDQFKMEVANELGVNLKQGYNGDLTSREAGSIGGEMTKRLVAQAANQMQPKQ